MDRNEQRQNAAEAHAEKVWKDAADIEEKSLTMTDFYAGAKWADENPAWVSVYDDLPKEEGTYLFHFDDGTDRVEAYYPNLTLSKQVTHWMPRPAAPKVERWYVEQLFLKIGEFLHDNMPKEFKSLDEINEFVERLKQELKDNG